MRQILFRIWIERPWAFWTEQVGDVPLLGACWLWLIGLGGVLAFHVVRGDRSALRDPVLWIGGVVGLASLALVGGLGVLPNTVPVFGYGTMVLIGFVSALFFVRRRAKQIGFDPNAVMDVATWILLAGVGGGRIAYLVQYGEHVFADKTTIAEIAFAAVNLTQGGLVLIGALVGGTLGFSRILLETEAEPLRVRRPDHPGSVSWNRFWTDRVFAKRMLFLAIGAICHGRLRSRREALRSTFSETGDSSILKPWPRFRCIPRRSTVRSTALCCLRFWPSTSGIDGIPEMSAPWPASCTRSPGSNWNFYGPTRWVSWEPE